MSVNLEKGQDNQNEYYMIEKYYTSIMHEFCFFGNSESKIIKKSEKKSLIESN